MSPYFFSSAVASAKFFRLNQGILRRAFSSGYGRPRGNSAESAMWSIIIANGAVFALSTYAFAQKDRRLVQRLYENFSMSLKNWKEGRVWTIVTHAFMHGNLAHFAFNMIALHAFGSIMTVAGLGAGHIYTLALGSALAGGIAFLVQQQQQQQSVYRPGQPVQVTSGLGASGIVMGAAAASTCLMPFAPMQLFFIPINIPLWMLTAVYFALDTYYLDAPSNIGHASHLGGGVFGVVYYFVALRRFGGVSRMLRR